MNQTAIQKQNTVGARIPTAVFAIAALALGLIGAVSQFTKYVPSLGPFFDLELTELSIEAVIRLLITLTPRVLLVLYLFLFYKMKVGHIFVGFAFAAVSVHYLSRLQLLQTIESIINGFFPFTPLTLFNYFIYFLLAAVFTLAAISAFCRFAKHGFIISAAVIGLVLELYFIPSTIHEIIYSFEAEQLLNLLVAPLTWLGWVAFYVAVLIFGCANKKDTPAQEVPKMPSPPIFTDAPVASTPKSDFVLKEAPSAEDELKSLNEMLQQGLITLEDYENKKAQVLKKL